MDLVDDIAAIPQIGDWRTLTTAASAFPKSTANFEQYAWHKIERFDWMSWELGIRTGKLIRKPAYSDYGVKAPGRPGGFGEASANVRYTADDYWLFRYDGKLKTSSKDMHNLCAELLEKQEFSGCDFSAGDKCYSAVASERTGPGNGQNWVQWATSHHLEYVVNQIHAIDAV